MSKKFSRLFHRPRQTKGQQGSTGTGNFNPSSNRPHTGTRVSDASINTPALGDPGPVTAASHTPAVSNVDSRFPVLPESNPFPEPMSLQKNNAPTVPVTVASAVGSQFHATSSGAPEGLKFQTPDQLWQLAYERVLEQDSKLVKTFTYILIHVADADKPKSANRFWQNKKVMAEDVDLEALHGNLDDLKEAVRQGLERTKTMRAKLESVGAVTEIMDTVTKVAEKAFSEVPHVSAVLVGVSLVLGGLRNAIDESAANSDGILYVAGKVGWYWELFRVRDYASQDSGLWLELGTMLVNLFTAIIAFQMRSVVTYNRRGLVTVLRDAFKFDSWAESLADIKAMESGFVQHVSQYEQSQTNCTLSVISATLKTIQEQATKQMSDLFKDRDELIGGFNSDALDYVECMDRNPHPAKDTCRWFHENNEVKQWDSEESLYGLLIIKAYPGQGKSVLARSLVHTWAQQERNRGTVCYFFFKETDKLQASPSRALCALLHQLFRAEPSLVLKLNSEIRQQGRGLYSSVSALWKLFVKAVMLAETAPVVCILDALDECHREDRGLLLNKIAEVQPSPTKLKFLLTTRPVWDVMEFFDGREQTALVNPNDNRAQLRSEIKAAIRERVEDMSKRKKWSPGLCERIIFQLKRSKYDETEQYDAPQDTYLWLRLVFELLDKTPKLSESQWLKMIKTLPASVNAAYEALLSNVDQIMQPLVFYVLVLMTAAPRPLTTSEMNTALAFAPGQGPETAMQYLPNQKEFKEWVECNCGFFVQVYQNRLQFCDG